MGTKHRECAWVAESPPESHSTCPSQVLLSVVSAVGWVDNGDDVGSSPTTYKKKLKKGIDKSANLCYNKDTKREQPLQKKRRYKP